MKTILSMLLVLAVASGCKKDITQLPDASQTGANTFGLKLDGQMWAPQKGIVNGAAILEARYSGTGGVFINARNFASSPTETEFEIFLKNPTGPGTYLLNQATANYPNESASYAYYVKRKLMPENEWITSDRYPGSVTLTKFDTVNHIISGTFEFSAGSLDNSAQPIKVTEGRFDVKIQ